jgi:N-acetylneuraminic acid mutarotase
VSDQLRHARAGLGVVTVDRNILAIGGFEIDESDVATVFDVVESRKVSGIGVWREVAPMPTSRDNFAAAVLRGQVYVAGGIGAVDTLAVVEVYNPKTGKWTTRKPLPRPRGASGAAVLGGLLYVAGGAFPVGVDDEEITNSMVVYDPGKNTWRTVAPMPTARIQLRLVAAGRYLYAIGGRGGPGNGMSMTTVERYDPRSDSWRIMAPMRERRAAPCVVETTVGNRHVLVVVAGAQFSVTGELLNGLRTTEVYDLATGRWKRIAPLLPTVRASLGCAVDADGAILAIGGGTRVGDVTVFLRNVDALLLKPRDIQ